MLGMSTGERWWSVKGEIAPARNPKEGVAMLGTFIGIKDGIEAILARDGITPAQRVILEEFRAIAGKNSWDFATLRHSLS